MGHKKAATTEAYIHPDARAIRKGIDDAKQPVSMRTYSILKQDKEHDQIQ